MHVFSIYTVERYPSGGIKRTRLLGRWMSATAEGAIEDVRDTFEALRGVEMKAVHREVAA